MSTIFRIALARMNSCARAAICQRRAVSKTERHEAPNHNSLKQVHPHLTDYLIRFEAGGLSTRVSVRRSAQVEFANNKTL